MHMITFTTTKKFFVQFHSKTFNKDKAAQKNCKICKIPI